MTLPIFQTQDKDLTLLQNRWASEINPVLRLPLTQGLTLNGISLISGVNVINHLLDRKQQGWIVTDIDGIAAIYRSQPFNSKTLTLTSNATVVVNLYVY